MLHISHTPLAAAKMLGAGPCPWHFSHLALINAQWPNVFDERRAL